MKEVYQGVYLGHHPAQENYQFFVDNGIRAELDLEEWRPDVLSVGYPFDIFFHLPTPDYGTPIQPAFQEGCRYIDACLSEGLKVYVHCAHGVGRSPTMVLAWLTTKGFTLDQAIAYLQEQYPRLHLSEEQINSLKEFNGPSTTDTIAVGLEGGSASSIDSPEL